MNYTTRRGYTLLKSNLDESETKKIRKELTIQPFEKQRFIVEKFGTMPPNFKIFLESHKKLYVPRFYGIEKFGMVECKLPEPKVVHFKFCGKLRPEQSQIIEEFLPKLQENNGGILNLKTGGGKTTLALFIASFFKVKCLVIVHKGFLVDQWIERIRTFLPNARIGKIQGSHVDTDADIVIGMIQSIAMKEYDDSVFVGFGLVIFDEVHHVAAKVFSKAFFKVPAKFVLGLSATLERKDGCERVLNYFIGHTYSPTNALTNFGEVHVKKINFEDFEYQKNFYNLRGNKNSSKMITNICESSKRIDLIVETIEQYIIKNKTQVKRHILVLSERLFQLENIHRILNDKKIENGKVIGGIKPNELIENCKKTVILATYSYVSEGFDVDTLDTLIFASPKSDIVQSVGRILRKVPEERNNIPLIVDIIDQFMILKYSKREKYYKKCKFTIT